MQINDELIDHLAKLSKLSFGDEEKEKMKHDFKQMLDFVDKLQEVDTDGVEPLIHMTKSVNQFRQDSPAEPFSQDEVVKNAPDHDGAHFKVPKVVKK